MKIRKKVWNNEKSKNRDNIMFLLLLDWTKICAKFSELQIFGYLSGLSFFILYCLSIIFKIKRWTNIFILLIHYFLANQTHPKYTIGIPMKSTLNILLIMLTYTPNIKSILR